MAAIVDWHFDNPLPIENFVMGAYNKMQISITSDAGAVFHHKFRIELTYGTFNMIKDVEPIAGEITLNPFTTIRDWLTVEDPIAFILIEIGEVYANLEDEPPTFRGYDETKQIQFYNGYAYTEEINYVEPGWVIPSFGDPIFKLPVVKGQESTSPDKIGENDERIVNGIAFFGDLLSATAKWSIGFVNGEFKDINGSVISSFEEIAGGVAGKMTGVDIGPTSISITYPSNWDTLEVWYQYRVGETASYIPSQRAYFIKETCPTYKYDRFRLRWFNRFSAYEYQNFWMKSKYTMIWDEGKELFTDGIDRPQLIRIGKSGTTEYELNSDWLAEDEQLALREMYESPCVTMFDPDNVEYDVIILDNSYEVTDLKDGLFKVKVRLKLARMNKSRLQ